MNRLYGGAASRTPLLGPPTRGMQPFTRTTTYPGGVNPYYKGPRTATPTAAPARTGKTRAAAEAISRALAQYQPGGGFGRGVEAGIERGRVKAMASGMQGLVGAGLAGTTMAGTLGKRYEEEVAMPARAGVEGRRAQAISGIRMAEAGMEFQAGETGAQRSLQLYLAQLQANLQRQEMARRDRPTVSMAAPTDGGYARQFPSLYDTGEQAVPNWMGGSGGGISPAASMFQRRVGDERRFDIDFGPGTLVG